MRLADFESETVLGKATLSGFCPAGLRGGDEQTLPAGLARSALSTVRRSHCGLNGVARRYQAVGLRESKELEGAF